MVGRCVKKRYKPDLYARAPCGRTDLLPFPQSVESNNIAAIKIVFSIIIHLLSHRSGAIDKKIIKMQWCTA